MKYPRTPHLPFSPGTTRDDRIIEHLYRFIDTPLVVTEKLDGSNVCLTSKEVLSRGSSPTHESFDRLKALHAQIKHLIPDDMYIYGEWCWAVHSIEYKKVATDPLYLFAIRCGNDWLDFGTVVDIAVELKLPYVPVLSRLVVSSQRRYRTHFVEQEDIEKFYNFFDTILKYHAGISALGGEMEGIVVRVEEQFSNEVFDTHVAKYVRKDHVQSEEHWMNLPMRLQNREQ